MSKSAGESMRVLLPKFFAGLMGLEVLLTGRTRFSPHTEEKVILKDQLKEDSPVR